MVEQDGRGVGRATRLVDDQFVDASRLDRGPVDGVPLDQLLLSLRCRENGHLEHALLALGDDFAEQRLIRFQHALDGGRGEQIGIEHQRQIEPRRLVLDVEGQIERRHRRVVEAHVADRQAGDRPGAHRDVLQHEHHLKNRRAAHVARRLQMIDELLERQVLVRVRVQSRSADLGKIVAKRGIGRQLAPQHQRVGEEAHQRLQLAPVPIGDRRADAHVALSTVAHQEHVKRRQQHHEQRGVLLRRQRAERRRELTVEPAAANVTCEGLHGGSGKIQRQFQRTGQIGQLIRPVA